MDAIINNSPSLSLSLVSWGFQQYSYDFTQDKDTISDNTPYLSWLISWSFQVHLFGFTNDVGGIIFID